MFYVPKVEHSTGLSKNEGRCRRRAPTLQGYPVVYVSDWCGEHKIGSNPVRDGGKPVGKNVVVSPNGTLVKEKPDLGGILNLHREYTEKEKAKIKIDILSAFRLINNEFEGSDIGDDELIQFERPMKKRKLRIRYTCSDFKHHHHKYRWTAHICGKVQFLMSSIRRLWKRVCEK